MTDYRQVASDNARAEFGDIDDGCVDRPGWRHPAWCEGDPLTLQEAYVLGICDGISAYAWMKYVGTTGRLLRDAIEHAMNGTYPPQRDVEKIR